MGFVSQRCLNIGVLVCFVRGLCHGMGVWCYKGVGKLVISLVCLGFVTWNGLFELQRCCVSGGCVGC